MNWGDVVTAVGVLIALLFGVLAEVHVVQDRRERTALEKRSQAAKVTAWLGYLSPDEPVAASEGSQAYLFVNNQSESPIYDALAWRRDDGYGWIRVGLVPPGQTVKRQLDDSYDPGNAGPYALHFVDARTRMWRRETNGALVEITRQWPFGENGALVWPEKSARKSWLRSLRARMVLRR